MFSTGSDTSTYAPSAFSTNAHSTPTLKAAVKQSRSNRKGRTGTRTNRGKVRDITIRGTTTKGVATSMGTRKRDRGLGSNFSEPRDTR